MPTCRLCGLYAASAEMRRGRGQFEGQWRCKETLACKARANQQAKEAKMAKQRELDEFEAKVLDAMKVEYEYLVLVIPSEAGINDLAAASALAGLKKKGLVKFEGRGKFRSVFLTLEGEELHRERAKERAKEETA